MADGIQPLTRFLMSEQRRHQKRQAESSSEPLTAAKFYIPSLPGLPKTSTLKLFAGHIPSTPPTDPQSDAHLFFLLARNKHIADRERLVIWLNGGPQVLSVLDVMMAHLSLSSVTLAQRMARVFNMMYAAYTNRMSHVACRMSNSSSFDGALMEIGPVRLVPGQKADDQVTVREVEGAWNEYANVLFVDQPAGTGYSYVSTNRFVHELDIAADHIVEFLHRFYDVFPEFQGMDTYIAGESFAGQYIPYTADAILKATTLDTPLRGILIGNGWISPVEQYGAYYDFALSNGVLTAGTKSAINIKSVSDNCNKTLTDQIAKDAVTVHTSACERILGSILDSTVQSVNGQKLCINTYDIRLTDTHPSCGMNWPPDLSSLYQYLPREDIKAAFHASQKEGGWVECSGQVGAQFTAQKSKPSVTLLPGLLEHIPVMLFAGQEDLICNWLGLYRTAQGLTWNGQTGFGDAKAQQWFVDGNLAGTWQTARNLTFVKVANASHMVAFDLPLVAHDMLLRFMNTDFISAAGSAAKVPSRIGTEQESVIGTTSPNGTALSVGDLAQEKVSDAANEQAGGITDQSKLPDKGVATAYYNVGSAAVLLFLLVAVGAIFFCLRAKLRKEMANNPDFGSYEAANASPPSTPRRRSHKRAMSTLSNGQRSPKASFKHGTLSHSHDHSHDHELEHLTHHQPEDDDLPDLAGGRDRRELFSVGDSDDESQPKS